MSSSGKLAALALVLLAGCGKGNDPTAWPAATSDPKILEARRLLTDAGFEFGRGFPKLTLLYNTHESHKKIAAAVQEMWRSKLGIEVELRNLDWRVFLDHLNRGEYDIGRRGYYGEYRDPHALLSLFTSGNQYNTTGWTSAKFDALIAASDEEPDPARRFELLARAERLLLDEGPILTIYHYQVHNLIKPFIRGVHPNARDMHPLQAVALEGEGRPADAALILHAGAEPSSLDPALAQDLVGLKLILNLFEGLVSYDPVDAHPVPAVAERWEISGDGKTYTFHLRPAQWSNGDPVTAHDFVYAWRRAVDPNTASAYAHRMFEVAAAREVASGAAPPSALGVRALDDRTLEVRLVHRAPYFLEMLCLHLFMPVHPPTVEKHGKDWTRAGNLVGNGPFRLVERREKDRVVFAKNPGYRAASEVKIEKVVALTTEDVETAFRMYEAGQCHWLSSVPRAFVEELTKRPDFHPNPLNGTLFYSFNLKRKPLDDARVRRALSLAVDREAIVKHILRGGELPAERLTPPLHPGYEVTR